jgi:hypothetical protein
MLRVHFHPAFPAFVFTVVTLHAMTGCRAVGGDLDGEVVTIRVLTLTDLQQYAHERTDWSAEEKAEFNARIESVTSVQTLGYADIGGLAVNFVFDLLKEAVAKEAALYERQFGATIYDDKFWDGPPILQQGQLQFSRRVYGFEIVRKTAAHPNDAAKNTPAFRMVCGFRANAADPRLFVIKPLAFQTVGAKAKVAGDGLLDTKIDIAIHATWIDKGQTTHVNRIALTSFSVESYHTKSHPVLIDELGDENAGWFAGIPVSVDMNGKPKGDGVYSITASITERDASKTKETIEEIGRIIEAQRERVRETIK